MKIYLDESYNVQRARDRQFISINRFVIENDRILRKRWKHIRRKYIQAGKIHASNPQHRRLVEKGIPLIGQYATSVISAVQDISRFIR